MATFSSAVGSACVDALKSFRTPGRIHALQELTERFRAYDHSYVITIRSAGGGMYLIKVSFVPSEISVGRLTKVGEYLRRHFDEREFNPEVRLLPDSVTVYCYVRP